MYANGSDESERSDEVVGKCECGVVPDRFDDGVTPYSVSPFVNDSRSGVDG